jgi:hypothetical protein
VTTFLGVIALATLVMALIQVGAIVYLARMARRIEGVLGRVERDLQPTVDRINVVSHEAAKAATLATMQLERIDKTLTNVAGRVDDTVLSLQRSLSAPAKEGAALMAAVRATVGALRDARDARRKRAGDGPYSDDDDYLFI